MTSGEEDPRGQEGRSRPVLSRGFWAAMALGLALVLAGAAVGLLGTRLFPPARPAAAAAARGSGVEHGRHPL